MTPLQYNGVHIIHVKYLALDTYFTTGHFTYVVFVKRYATLSMYSLNNWLPKQ